MPLLLGTSKEKDLWRRSELEGRNYYCEAREPESKNLFYSSMLQVINRSNFAENKRKGRRRASLEELIIYQQEFGLKTQVKPHKF